MTKITEANNFRCNDAQVLYVQLCSSDRANKSSLSKNHTTTLFSSGVHFSLCSTLNKNIQKISNFHLSTNVHYYTLTVSHLNGQLKGRTTAAAHSCNPCLTSLVPIHGGDEMCNSSCAYVMFILASCLTWLA